MFELDMAGGKNIQVSAYLNIRITVIDNIQESIRPHSTAYLRRDSREAFRGCRFGEVDNRKWCPIHCVRIMRFSPLRSVQTMSCVRFSVVGGAGVNRAQGGIVGAGIVVMQE